MVEIKTGKPITATFLFIFTVFILRILLEYNIHKRKYLDCQGEMVNKTPMIYNTILLLVAIIVAYTIDVLL